MSYARLEESTKRLEELLTNLGKIQQALPALEGNNDHLFDEGSSEDVPRGERGHALMDFCWRASEADTEKWTSYLLQANEDNKYNLMYSKHGRQLINHFKALEKITALDAAGKSAIEVGAQHAANTAALSACSQRLATTEGLLDGLNEKLAPLDALNEDLKEAGAPLVGSAGAGAYARKKTLGHSFALVTNSGYRRYHDIVENLAAQGLDLHETMRKRDETKAQFEAQRGAHHHATNEWNKTKNTLADFEYTAKSILPNKELVYSTAKAMFTLLKDEPDFDLARSRGMLDDEICAAMDAQGQPKRAMRYLTPMVKCIQEEVAAARKLMQDYKPRPGEENSKDTRLGKHWDRVAQQLDDRSEIAAKALHAVTHCLAEGFAPLPQTHNYSNASGFKYRPHITPPKPAAEKTNGYKYKNKDNNGYRRRSGMSTAMRAAIASI